MIVKLRKGQKIFKKFENDCKFKQKLAKIQDNNIFKTISLSQESMQYPCFKSEIVSLAQKKCINLIPELETRTW